MASDSNLPRGNVCKRAIVVKNVFDHCNHRRLKEKERQHLSRQKHNPGQRQHRESHMTVIVMDCTPVNILQICTQVLQTCSQNHCSINM